MLYRGVFVTEMSGAVDGVVAARNRGGSYFRNRVVPVDPETTRQINCRTAMEQLWSWWTTTMNASERDDWERYAREKLRTGRIGQERELVGWTAFCRQHFHKFQAIEQLSIAFDPGTAVPLYPAALNAVPTATYESATEVNIEWSPGDTWVNDHDNALLLYTTNSISPFRNFCKGPYQLRAAVLGDSEDPPTSPQVRALGFTPDPGSRIFYRLWFVSNDMERAGYYAGRIDWPP